MPICIYPQDSTDFSTNGLGWLTPISCVAYGDDGHYSELVITQPIDDTLRWAQLSAGAIIKAPVPARESPFYEAVEDIVEGEDATVLRAIYRVRVRTHLRLRSGPGTGYAILGAYGNGTQVISLEYSGGWHRVAIRNGGRTGWMSGTYLDYVRTETEVISQQKVVGQRVVKYRQAEDQLWRIYRVEPDTEKGVVTARAQHIFYDLQYNLVGDDYAPENQPGDAILREMWGRLVEPPAHALHVAAGLDGVIEGGDYGYKNPIECMLDPETGILTQARARLVLDNFDVFALPDNPRDCGVTLRRGKNLQGVKVTDDSSGVVTRIIPRGKTRDGDPLYITDGTGPGSRCVDSANIVLYHAPRMRMVDYDVRMVDRDPDNEKTFTDVTRARAKLRQLAEADFEENGVDLPEYGMKVNFVLIQGPDADDYAGLQAVFLGDTVTVIDSLIGLSAKVRVTGFKFNCLTKQYDEITLGDVDELTQTVYNYNLPTGGISGAKIAPNSLSGEAVRSMSIQYAKIATAAVERLSADAITALTAYVGSLTAETVTADELVAAMANVLSLTAGNIDAETISTDRLGAAVALITEVVARYGTFEDAAVRHLVSATLNITDAAVAERILIENLAVMYAQVVSATIGSLCLRASDGNYYDIDVGSDGAVTATRVELSDEEIAQGHTDGGRPIVATEITADVLNTGDIYATYALVNQIDAARIDVDQLFAREAFVQRLDAALVTSGSVLDIVTRLDDVERAEGDVERQLRLWFRFDSDRGLVVQKLDEDGSPASIWYTVTDELGYHIGRQDQREYVFSAYRDRVRVQNLEIGNIIAKPSGTGGWVWVRSVAAAEEPVAEAAEVQQAAALLSLGNRSRIRR